MIDAYAHNNHAAASADHDEIERRLREALAVAGPVPVREDTGGPDPGAPLQDATRRLLARVRDDGLADISYAPVDSPFGPLLLAATRRGLLRLAFPEEDVDGVLEGLARRVSPRIVQAREPLQDAMRELDEYFGGARHSFEVAVDWALVEAPFGRRVLRVTAEIPFGGVRSYGEVAADAGSPRGQRAAGNALNSNPVPIVIPCHRVLRTGGALGGYGGGTDRKRFLLELEGALGQRAD